MTNFSSIAISTAKMSNDTQNAENADDLYLKNEILYEYLYGDFEGKIILYITIFFIFLIGPILMIGIVIFEMFGGDSQKRTIINRLLSGFLGNVAVFGFMTGVSRIIRDSYGLVDSRLGMCIQFTRMGLKNAMYLYYSSMTIWRFLFIVVWKRMKGVQDNFFSTFITLSIYVFCVWGNVGKIVVGFNPNEPLFIYLYDKPKTNATTKAIG